MSQPISHITRALPFWASLLLVPLAWASALIGGWAIILVPLGSWVLFSVLDGITGLNLDNEDPETPVEALFWYRMITWVWPFLQIATVMGVLAFVVRSDLAWWEMLGVAIGLGILGGSIGIVYAHELMHQPSRFERWLGDILLASVLYGHFRSEHLLVHHTYVATPRDAVTARYNEHFHAFFFRVVPECLQSAWMAERTRLLKVGLSPWSLANPFWRYGTWQAGFLLLAGLLAGWLGVALYLFHALVAIWQLELVNYMEHYGLTRKHLGEGKYERAGPHHSWNAAHRATNWLLINLQRHSDHHARPDRRFPLLQNTPADAAPQLPYGYAVMGFMAMIPPLWRRRMNPKVREWRKLHYPAIKDWQPYKTASLPMPR